MLNQGFRKKDAWKGIIDVLGRRAYKWTLKPFGGVFIIELS